MKARALIDFAVQTLIVAPVAIIFLFFAFTGHIESIGVIALYGALILGPWQLIGSLITTIGRRPFVQWRRIHLIGSGLYLAICAVAFGILKDKDPGDFIWTPVMVVGFGVPIVLALFYYYITYRTFQSYRQKK
jgi:hypothetical protein